MAISTRKKKKKGYSAQKVNEKCKIKGNTVYTLHI